MALTAAQREAVGARGNVLVVAGAGTGKTRTLVERCLDCLISERPRASLEEILLVTFTEAASAEMRQRIRARLEEELARNPQDMHWQEQLALFEAAHIGTIHSFCFELVRSHFYELELDPQLLILPEEEARLLAEETLDQILQAHYAGNGAVAAAVQQLIQAQAKGSDQPIRALVMRLHNYAQTLPNPAGWLENQLAVFANPEPEPWRKWLLEALTDWRNEGVALLADLTGNPVAAECIRVLEAFAPPAGSAKGGGSARSPGSGDPTHAAEESLGLFSPALSSRGGEGGGLRGSKGSKRDGLVREIFAPWATALADVLAAGKNCPQGKKKLWLKPLEDFFEDCRFLHSLTETSGAADPLQEDWEWVRGHMTTLLGLAREFAAAFAEAKREMGVLDFHDLEQYALRLLWDNETGGPTNVARQWREQLRFIFVDEYQDINAAQDRIIQALSRETAGPNRFLVGDVKQSIYRFRLANPHIFQGYVETWRHGPGRVIPLQENFRSRKEILDFINSVFEQLMHRELGGIEYDQQAQLRFGERPAGNASPAPERGACVEIQLRIKGSGLDEGAETPNPGPAAELADLEEAGREARAVALRLQALVSSGHPVWDQAHSQVRPVQWRDISILLRAPSNKAESYAKEFARLNVPLQVARGGFYDSLEITDLLSLLQVLDNPLQDLPLLALLHSPLVGLTLDELARIRLAARRTSYWTALVRWRETNAPKPDVRTPKGKDLSPQAEVQSPGPTVSGVEADIERTGADARLLEKVSRFLDRFGRWRRMARQAALSRCLEAVLAETQYAAWIASQPRGEQRCANIKRLLLLAQRFDQLQRQGLFRFLRFIEAQRRAETEPELTAVSSENAVRLMSIHQSKGLEFPVVVLADMGKPFNLGDLRAEIILDEQYGLSPQVKPPQTGKRYPSLPHWLAARRQHRELLGEELRLLYVGMSRARDLLILSGSVSRQSFEKLWSEKSEMPLHKARSFSDWLGAWFGRHIPAPAPLHGENDLVRWTIHDDRALVSAGTAELPEPEGKRLPPEIDPGLWQELDQRFARPYPFATSTRLPAKTSVSALRRRAVGGDDNRESAPFLPGGNQFVDWKARTSPKASAVDVGNAHHEFLQFVALEGGLEESQLRKEAQRLVSDGALRPEQIDLLDFKAIASFWSSDLGQRIRKNAASVKRELPFTFRLAASELSRFTGEPDESVAADDFVVVQGIADLAVILPEEIWLVDFKTDREASEEETAAKGYHRQLQLYARGLSLIFRRPVTEAWLHYLSAGKSVRVTLA